MIPGRSDDIARAIEAPERSREAPDKIFCIGANKTGTTTLAALFASLNLTVGDQRKGEWLMQAWAARDFRPIVELARLAQVHQDAPFSLPFTFQAMDGAFPGSKFILSVRDDADQWYESLTRYHSRIVGVDRLPTTADLSEFPYIYKGWLLHTLTLVFGSPEGEPYHRKTLVEGYELHNEIIRRYFRQRPASLLVVNLAAPDAAERIIDFIGLQYRGQQMLHLNRS